MDASISQRLSLSPRQVTPLVNKLVGESRDLPADVVLALTATIDTVLQRVFKVSVSTAAADQDTGARSKSGFLLPRHLQLALRGKPLGLLATIASVPKLTHLTNFFLDGATAALLSEDQRLPESTGVPSATVDSRDERSEEELIKAHDEATAEWKKRKDDLVSDVDLMRSLNHVHPAYSLTHDALIFMLAFCREFCTALIEHVATLDPVPAGASTAMTGDAAADKPPPTAVATASTEAGTADTWSLARVQAAIATFLHPPLLKQVQSMSSELVQRLRGEWTLPASIKVVCHRLQGEATTASKCISLSSTDKLEVLVGKLSRAWRLQHGNTVFVHRGNVIHDASTVASVCLASGATVFAVDAKWWAFKRRERARRGLLTSTKFKEGEVKQMRRVASKVKNERQTPRSFAAAQAKRRAAAKHDVGRVSPIQTGDRGPSPLAPGGAPAVGAGVAAATAAAATASAPRTKPRAKAVHQGKRKAAAKPQASAGRASASEPVALPATNGASVGRLASKRSFNLKASNERLKRQVEFRNAFGFVGPDLPREKLLRDEGVNHRHAALGGPSFRLIESPAVGCRPDLSKLQRVPSGHRQRDFGKRYGGVREATKVNGLPRSPLGGRPVGSVHTTLDTPLGEPPVAAAAAAGEQVAATSPPPTAHDEVPAPTGRGPTPPAKPFLVTGRRRPRGHMPRVAADSDKKGASAIGGHNGSSAVAGNKAAPASGGNEGAGSVLHPERHGADRVVGNGDSTPTHSRQKRNTKKTTKKKKQKQPPRRSAKRGQRRTPKSGVQANSGHSGTAAGTAPTDQASKLTPTLAIDPITTSVPDKGGVASLQQLSARLDSLERQASRQSVRIHAALEAQASPVAAEAPGSSDTPAFLPPQHGDVDSEDTTTCLPPRTPVRRNHSSRRRRRSQASSDSATATTAAGAGRRSPLQLPESKRGPGNALPVSAQSHTRSVAESTSTVGSAEVKVAPDPGLAAGGLFGEPQQKQLLAANEASLAALRSTLATAHALAQHFEAAQAVLTQAQPPPKELAAVLDNEARRLQVCVADVQQSVLDAVPLLRRYEHSKYSGAALPPSLQPGGELSPPSGTARVVPATVPEEAGSLAPGLVVDTDTA